MTLVVCEDDIDLLNLIETIFTVENFEVLKASSVEGLKKVISEKNFDIIVIDYWLKDKKADNIIKYLQINFKEIPIVLISAINNIEEVAFKLNLKHFIKKPFEINDLIYKVKNL